MPKRCAYGNCKSDSRYPQRLEGGVVFFAFPKPKTQEETCRIWIQHCGRLHTELNPWKINKNTYVCSKHFVNGRPTPENPYPVAALHAPVQRRDLGGQRKPLPKRTRCDEHDAAQACTSNPTEESVSQHSDTENESLCQPPMKVAKNISTSQQIPSHTNPLCIENVNLSIQASRQYEECVPKVGRNENAGKDNVSQMAVWREILDAQNNLFKELLCDLPLSTPKISQSPEDIQKCFSEMDRDFHERERLLTQEQRQFEKQRRKEVNEARKQKWDRQMIMWREMQETHNNVFREILSRLPLLTPPTKMFYHHCTNVKHDCP